MRERRRWKDNEGEEGKSPRQAKVGNHTVTVRNMISSIGLTFHAGFLCERGIILVKSYWTYVESA